MLKASHDKAEVARLNASLDRLSGDLGLAGIATVEQKIDTILERADRHPSWLFFPRSPFL